MIIALRDHVRLRRLLVPVLIAGLLLGPAAGATRRSAARRSAARGIPDVTVLFGRAVKLVRATKRPAYAKAIMLEADGMTRGGRCTQTGCFGGHGVNSASGVVAWRFVFNNQATSQRIRSASVFYGPAPKGFGKVTGYAAPFVNDLNIAKAPRMTLAQALGLVRRAGHRGPFFNVTLRNPLGPRRSNVLYIFGFARGFIAVDTVTKKVSALG